MQHKKKSGATDKDKSAAESAALFICPVDFCPEETVYCR